MKRLLACGLILFVGVSCVSAAQEIQRLSPVPQNSKIPLQCRVASVLKESPAEKAGIVIGDILLSLNSQMPKDASGLSDLVAAAPQESEFNVLKMNGSAARLRVHLNKERPRLGAVCDLTGWTKPGVTAAGNESITIFDGPFAMTVSGIIDKGIVFLRIRLTNDTAESLTIGPDLFRVTAAGGKPVAVLSPKDVMCVLYGEKGAHLLALKKKRKDTMDTHEANLLGLETGADERCDGTSNKGRLRSSDSDYAEANAQYLATESFWSAPYKAGEVADGLIYLAQPAGLPITLSASVAGHTFSAQLGLPQATGKAMKRSELAVFFEARKKGDSIRITLKKGKVYVARFSTYDPIEERVWYAAPAGGLLNSSSASLETIRSAEPLEAIPAKPIPH